MIASLRGMLTERLVGGDRSVGVDAIVEVAGVGYQITMTAATLSRLPSGEEVIVYIHHHIRESDQKLFGFLSLTERSAFEGLLGAHGVGPSLALAVLSTHPAAQLERILADDDLAALCEVPGVGKKTAQRLLVELKSTLVIPTEETTEAGGVVETDGQTAIGDVREALSSLGYSSEEIRKAVIDLPADAEDSGPLLKQALRTLAG